MPIRTLSDTNLGARPRGAGVVIGGPSPEEATNPFGEGSYEAALETTASDYDKIMSQYGDLLGDRPPVQQLQHTPITPRSVDYQASPALTSALSSLRSFSKTGGYDPSGISAIRSRAISPIRSVYAGAQRNLDRQRSLQGGYSPNYTAATTRMAREMGGLVGEATTGIEADIAERTAGNRLQALQSLAPLAAEESRASTAIQMANVDAMNRAMEINQQLPLQYGQFNSQAEAEDFMRRMAATEGMRGLYGTSPALLSTVGNQVLSNRQLDERDDGRRGYDDSRLALGLLGQFGRAPSLGRG